MANELRLMRCPGCGAPLSLQVEPGRRPDDGVLLCEHGHVYELDDPDDDRSLQAAIGADYKRQIVEHSSLH